MIGWALAAMVPALAAGPFVRERLKRPFDRAAAQTFDGEFSVLSHGATAWRWHGAGQGADRGPDQGPVLVLVHGLSTPSWVFEGLIPGLTMLGFRVLSFDLYGRGLSARPAGVVHDRALFVGQLEELLAAAGVDGPVTLLGYSMGGAIAAAWAAAHPERVARLLLLAPAGIDYTPAPLLDRAARLGWAGDWLWLLAGGAHLRRAARRAAAGPTSVPELARRLRREVATRGFLPAILSSQRHMLAEPQEDEHRALARAGVPILAIWGAEDRVIPETSMGKLAQWNRAAWQVAVPGAGHDLVHSRPQEILAAIAEYLRSTTGGP